jgi:cation diffusion facilitator family transporter
MSERTSEAGEHQEDRIAALGANLLIAAAKFVAGPISGGAAMFAEAAHYSMADTTNQIFLLVSLRTSRRTPDENHPYGHGQDRFFWAFLVAVLIFFVGALFSIYHGVTVLLHAGDGHRLFLLN